MEIEGCIPKRRTTIYIEPNLWKQFQKINKREGISSSRKLEKFIAREVLVHGEGNPQSLLESYGEATKKICWKCRGSFPDLIHVRFLSGIKRRICKTCFEEYKKRKLVRKILK